MHSIGQTKASRQPCTQCRMIAMQGAKGCIAIKAAFVLKPKEGKTC
jgi:hypothetical protein